jgi:hypothetical protein
MNFHRIAVAVLTLTGGPAIVSAVELGRLDMTAPGAMVSVCGGLNYSGSAYAIGDKGYWLPGQFSCNAAQSGGSVAQSAAYVVSNPEPVNASASGAATLGQMHLFAHSHASPAAGFAQAEATAGWVDTLTFTPVNPSDIGKTAQLSFTILAEGTLAGQDGSSYSPNSMAGLGIKPYVNDAALPPGPGAEFVVGGQGQYNFPYNQTVNQLVSFSANITLGTAFELGIFARALAGNAASGYVYVANDATVDFQNTLSWAGITTLTVAGSPVAFTLSSASGIDWTQPYAAPVPEPQAWALWAAGLLGMGALRGRARGSNADAGAP